MLKFSEEKLIIIVAALSQLAMQLVANMATVIIPEIAMELSISADLQLYINIVYLCSLVASCIPIAKVVSQYGVKKAVKISCWLIIFSLLLITFTASFVTILIARFIQGICCATLGITIYMMLVEELDDEELGTALGLVGSSGYVGLMLAPSITGLITYFFDWKVAFMSLIPIFLIQLLLLSMIKGEWKQEKSPFDRVGSLIYIVMMILFTVGLTELDSVLNLCFLISIILVPVFLRYEKRQDHPIVNVKLFRNVKMMIGTYAAMATYFVTTIATTVLTYHLVYPADMDLSLVGLVLLATPITMIFVSAMAGKLSGKIDPRLISGAGLMIICVSMVMFAALNFLSIELIIVACVIQGIGHGLFSSPNNKYVLTLPDEEDLSDTSAILATSKEFGKIMSSGIYTLLFAFFLEDVVLGPTKYDGALVFTNHIMMVITIILVISAAILIFYSYFKYERYENPAILAMVYRLIPDRFKDGARVALNLKDTAIDSTLNLRHVFKLDNVINITKDTAISIKDTTIDTATSLKDTTMDTAVNIKDTTVDTATNIKDSTIDTASNIKDTTFDTATNIKDKIIEKK